MPPSRSLLDLFLVSALVLFLELACIRWFPAHVMFLSFFTNSVLLASFIGMSIGCLIARRPADHIRYTPYWLAFALACGLLTNLNQSEFLSITNVGDQHKPEIVFFSADTTAPDELAFRVPVELIGGVFFVLVALCHIGPGQELGRAFNRATNRNKSYAFNLLGSLVGIGTFFVASWLQLPPLAWFVPAVLLLGYFVRKLSNPILPLVALGLSLAVVAFTSFGRGGVELQWSPYYRIEYRTDNQVIWTNLSGHQRMIPIGMPTHAPYDLPYLFQKELKAEWPEFQRILVIGAGSGNDLSRAMAWCGPNTIVDAVEIDPVIQQLGMRDHPNKPYDDKRIVRHLNDGRNFLRQANAETYDLVVFALVDSLVLHSGYSSLRLESFLFTEESFADVRRVLKPTGVTAVYNFFRHGWIVGRLRDQLTNAFGAEPVVIVDPPYRNGPEVPLDIAMEANGNAVLFAGQASAIKPLREKFASGPFWVPGLTGMTKELPGRFGPAAPTIEYKERYGLVDSFEANRPLWVPLRATAVEESKEKLRTATDDWPFLYVRQPSLPSLTRNGIILTLILSALLWAAFHYGTKREADLVEATAANGEWSLALRAFFLGAGFMLIETKAVVQMALLFGSTWNVNTYVFAAILIMAVLGNLFTGAIKPKRLEPYYVGLFAAIAVGLVVPMKTFLGLSPAVQIVASCALVFAPILFAGVIFPTTFARSTRPDRYFAANVIGALVGGLAENASMLLGFQYLLLVAGGFYALSACFGGAGSRSTTGQTPVATV